VPCCSAPGATPTRRLTQRDAPESRFDLGSPRLFVAHVLGEPTDRGLAFRAMRLATVEDVRALMPEAFEP